jgi:membrane protease YdiL (CAAX protease family)
VTAQYLCLAVILALTLNHANRYVRACGTLIVAIALAFIVLSIYLADTDGTFAALPAPNLRPELLNTLAVLAVAAILFLLWAAWRQLHRPLPSDMPWRNTEATFGLVSRGAHWAIATLVLCLIPIGLFMQSLPPPNAATGFDQVETSPTHEGDANIGEMSHPTEPPSISTVPPRQSCLK